MIERVRTFERQRRRARKLALREARKSGDAKLIAQALGNADPDPPYRCKESRSFQPAPLREVPGAVLQVEAIVRMMPGWMRQVVIVAYVKGRCDRNGAQDLRMSKRTFTERREAAVEFVAERLRERGVVAHKGAPQW